MPRQRRRAIQIAGNANSFSYGMEDAPAEKGGPNSRRRLGVDVATAGSKNDQMVRLIIQPSLLLNRLEVRHRPWFGWMNDRIE